MRTCLVGTFKKKIRADFACPPGSLGHLCRTTWRADHRLMLDADTLADLEGDADEVHRSHRSDPGDPVCPDELCRRVLGTTPQLCQMAGLADLSRFRGEWIVRVNRRCHPDRVPELVAHEVAEGVLKIAGYIGADIEHRADALGARLLAPRAFFLGIVRAVGHRVHALARASLSTQSLALLRLGEVTGRPVALVRRPAIVRGDLYGWPEDLDAVRRRPPRDVHPVRVDDRWGLMAERC